MKKNYSYFDKRNFYKNILHSPFLIFLTIFFISHVLFINYENLSVEAHSRLITLKQILSAGNEGFFYQIGKLIPMDVIWEDPMTGFILSTVQLIGKSTTLWKIDIYFIYHLQFIILSLAFFLPYLKNLFFFPKTLFFIVPLYFLLSINFDALYYSYDNYWVQNISVFITCIYLSSFIYLINQKVINLKKIIILSFVTCFFLGFLSLMRRNIFYETLLILILFGSFLFLISIFLKKKINFIICLIPTLIFILSYNLQLISIKQTWEKRDEIYNIQMKERNPTHPLWAPLYVGLGMVKNDLDIKWDDGALYWNLKKEFPNFDVDKHYGKEIYEEKTKELYFKTIKENPELFINSILKKTLLLFEKHRLIIISLFFLILLSLVSKKYLYFGYLSIITLISTASVPILTSIYYAISFRSVLLFWSIFFSLSFLYEILFSKEKILKNKFYNKLIIFLDFFTQNVFLPFGKVFDISLIKIRNLFIVLSFIFLTTISILYATFKSLNQTNFLILNQSNTEIKYIVSWTTERDKFFDSEKSSIHKILTSENFEDYTFKINNDLNDLKYLQLSFLSKIPLNIKIKEIRFLDKEKKEIENIIFEREKHLKFLSPSKNIKEIVDNYLLVHKNDETGENFYYEERLNPYIGKIKMDTKFLIVKTAVQNNFKPRFKDWIFFLASEKSNN